MADAVPVDVLLVAEQSTEASSATPVDVVATAALAAVDVAASPHHQPLRNFKRPCEFAGPFFIPLVQAGDLPKNRRQFADASSLLGQYRDRLPKPIPRNLAVDR